MPSWKSAVARAFDRAEAYDAAAVIQAAVAEGLARRIAGLSLPPSPRLLEIGCGTGFLTGAVLDRVRPGLIVVSDLSPAMVRRCREGLGHRPELVGLVMDGERPGLAPGFDLICSSLAAQWFQDLEGALGRLAGLLAPNGILAVTTLASGTFREWRRAHEAVGSVPATPAYPCADAIARLTFAGCATDMALETVVEPHADGRAFLASLRAIGAQTPGPAEVLSPEVLSPGALSPGTLRRVLRRFEAGGASITYEVATLLIRRQG